MRRLVLALCMGLALLAAGLLGQTAPPESDFLSQASAPTLVPPTPVPAVETGELDILPSSSAVGRIQENGLVRVGILYNAPPFGELNIRGEVAGYDADLARSIAETWGVEVEFVQVTRQPERSVHLLRSGEVDMLIAAQVHHRDLDRLVEFSQSYYMGRQSVMARADDPVEFPAQMAGRRLGVVIATPAREALSKWMERTGLSASVETYLTLDRAYVALVNDEVDGIVDSGYRLRQVALGLQRPDLTRILEEPLELEPFAIAVLRQDVHMRNLVNHTLQHLTVSGRMEEIHQTYFPGEAYDVITVWDNLGEDAPTPDQFATDLSFPAEYIVPRIQAGQVVRVAGLIGVTADSGAPESERRWDTFHRSLLQEMASRWGTTVEFTSSSAQQAVTMVAEGQADIAVGIKPDWDLAGQVDFTGSYLLHGERLLIRADDNIAGFSDLGGGRIVVTPNNEPTAASRAVEIAESVNVRIEIEQLREQDLGFALLADEDLDAAAVFGDSLKLVPHVQAEPERLRLTLDENDRARWYSRTYLSLAVPYNDIDFRLLVEYTLQEMARDGTLQELLEPLILPQDMPRFEIWPGPATYLTFNLNG
jgi:polar amino acid transport system substrate-binding protein